MRSQENNDPLTSVVIDHRPKVAEKKRQVMRSKLIDAAMQVFADSDGMSPVIEDVIRKADVSRGTFYNYFDSMDQVLIAIGQKLNDQMTADILPVYDVLIEPWQRAAVGFRLFLVRASLDRQWAGFVSRVESWQHNTLVADYMSGDLEKGRRLGQFSFDNLEAATDFLMGASLYGIQAIDKGVEHLGRYLDTNVHMSLASLGCPAEQCARGVTFSREYLDSWANDPRAPGKPEWALKMATHQGD